MKSLYQTALLLLSATLPLASCADEPIREIAVTMCPESSNNDYCTHQGPIIIRADGKDGPAPPVFPGTLGAFAMMYEADYELSWVSSNDEAIEMDIIAGNYTHKPDIKHGQQSYVFCLKDLAQQMHPAKIETDSNTAILGSIAELRFSVSMSHPASANNVSYSVMSKAQVMTFLPYDFVTSGMERQYAQGKKDNYNKWKLGVGIGVGLGVPILMALSFFLGARRSSRKASA